MDDGTEIMDTGQDIGFSIESQANVFELFAKQQKPDGAVTPVVLDDINDPTKTGAVTTSTSSTAAQQPSQSQGGPAGGTDAAAEKEKQDLENKNALDKLIAEHTKGNKVAGADNTSGAAADKGTQGKTDTEAPAADSTPAVIYSHYAEKGVLEKLPEGETAEGEELLDKAIEHTVETRLDARANEFIEDAMSKNPKNTQYVKDLITHLAKGGDPHTFQETRRFDSFDPTLLDSDKPEIQTDAAKTLLTNYYASLQWDKATIDRKIARLETAGPAAMVDEAKDVLPAFKKANEAAKAGMTEAVNREATTKAEAVKALNTGIQSTITSATTVAGYDISTPQAKQKINDYMYKPTVVVDGKKVPQFMADRVQKQNTPGYQVALAVLMMNDFKIDAKAVETKAVKSLQEKLGNMSSGKQITTAGHGTENSDANQGGGILDFEDPGSVITLPSRR